MTAQDRPGRKKIERSVSRVPSTVYIQVTAARFSEYAHHIIGDIILCNLYYV